MGAALNPSAGGGPGKAALSRRDLLVGGALTATALAAGLMSWPRGSQLADSSALSEIVPGQIGAWRVSEAGGVLIPVADVPGSTSYDDVLTRYYVDGRSGMIMFLIAYGTAQAGRTQLHRPEACYPAAGFTLHGSREVSLANADGPTVEGRTITAVKPGRIEQILYWSRIGDEFPTTSTAQSFSTIRQSVLGALPDGALVRMSTIDTDRGAGLRRLQAFSSSLLAHPKPSLQKLLTGAA